MVAIQCVTHKLFNGKVPIYYKRDQSLSQFLNAKTLLFVFLFFSFSFLIFKLISFSKSGRFFCKVEENLETSATCTLNDKEVNIEIDSIMIICCQNVRND